LSRDREVFFGVLFARSTSTRVVLSYLKGPTLLFNNTRSCSTTVRKQKEEFFVKKNNNRLLEDLEEEKPENRPLIMSTDAKLISGTLISKEIQEELRVEVAAMKEKYPDLVPKLAIVQVGGREDSNVYIRMKIKAASDIGMLATHHKFPREITEEQLLDELNKLNNDPKVHGIIVQMPLDCDNPIDSHKVTDAVDASKDVDGLCTINEGRVAIGDLESGFMPCTPFGCIELIRRTGVKIEGAKAVILGRSKIVGTPVSELLKWYNATITVCHSKTKNLAEECRAADILVVAIGRPEMVKKDWVKPGAIVIDCGINAIPDSTKKSGQRLVGDVAFNEVKEVSGGITPVPGGVGPMTVCMLMKNTVIAAKKAMTRFEEHRG